MKHAGPSTLDQLGPLLARIRTQPGLKEKSRGVFYFRSRSVLHFHEDAAGTFADLRVADVFERLAVDSLQEQEVLLQRLKQLIKS